MNAERPASADSSFQQPPSTPEIHPPADDIAEHRKIRKREMASISERLGHLPKVPRSQVWGALAAILFGGAVGGAIAALEMSPHTNKVIYWLVIGGIFLGGALAAGASLTTHEERADSITAIKADLDRLLVEGDNPSNS